MRLVDRWVGVPLCAALTGVRKLMGDDDAQVPPRSILFIKLAEQGSTVLAVSALRRAVEMVGREHVYFMVFEENRFILDLLEIIPRENVIPIKTGGIAGTLGRTLAAVREARVRDIDAVIDLEFFARSSAALAYLSGARRRVGFHARDAEGPYRGDLMTHRMRFNPHQHASETFRSLVDALEHDGAMMPTATLRPVRDDGPAATFSPTEDERTRVRGIVTEAAGTEDVAPLILLNANCSDLIPLRAWPRERYVELAHRLLDAVPGCRIALTGAPAEAEPARALAEAVGSERCFSLAGRTSLRDLLVLCTIADVMVTNDSGPAHFATLTPVDVVTLFGPEHPALFGARSPRNHILWAGLACSPCVSALNNRVSRCRDNLCMQEITVDAVLGKLQQLLAARAAGVASTEIPPVEIVTLRVTAGRRPDEARLR